MPRHRLKVPTAGPVSDLLGSPEPRWSRRPSEPRHADRPPSAAEARAVLAASLGLDPEELRGMSGEGATLALTRLRELVRRLSEQAAIDELTGALRRGAGYAAARAEIERAHRTGTPLTLVVVDIDGLKRINDTAGHLAGDAVLRRVAQELGGAMRPYDVLIRFGGDEFLSALGGAAMAQAKRRFATVQARLAVEHISISAGFAALGRGDVLDDLISRADADLYEGRRSDKPGAPPSQRL
jgi:diguanylate cyclase (GGDEF)-like protein